MAGAVGEAGHEPHRPRCRRAPVLRADDVPVPVGGGAARRQPLRVHGQRHLWTIPAAAGAHRVRADGLRRVRDPLRELRAQGRDAPGRPDPAEHRQLPPPAEARRADDRLAPRAVDDRSARTTSGRSGSSCSSTSAGWRTRSARPSTGARTTRPCSPTSRSSPASASGAAPRSSSASSSSGSSASPTTPARLLANLDRLDWSETTKPAQRNWIGRSDGAEIIFRVQDLEELGGQRRRSRAARRGEFTAEPIDIRVFTTRPDTIFGATYLVLAPEHPLVDALTTDEQRDDGRGVPRARGEAGPRLAQGEQGEDRRLHRLRTRSIRRRSSRSRSGSPTTC